MSEDEKKGSERGWGMKPTCPECALFSLRQAPKLDLWVCLACGREWRGELVAAACARVAGKLVNALARIEAEAKDGSPFLSLVPEDT